MRGHGITMIEVPHLVSIEAYGSFFAIHADTDLAVISDVLDSGEVTIGYLQIPQWSCKLHLISNSKLALDLAVRCDSAQP